MKQIVTILREYYENPGITQRELASVLDLSLGSAHRFISMAEEQGLLEKSESMYSLTQKGMDVLEAHRVHSAVIIAAGFGSRFVPLTFDTPKGLLKVYGVPMIERQIEQLHEVGITDITIVVGYLKEKFDYLIDKYQVRLLYNPEYTDKNTIATLYHARSCFYGKNVYLLSSDNWLRRNMYHAFEAKAWYSASFMEGKTKEWCLTYNKKGLITDVHVGGENAYVMYGPAYFSREFTEEFFPVLERYYHTPGTESDYWEQVYADSLHGANPMTMYINKQPPEQVYEFENLEELREFDEVYHHTSDNAAMKLIAEVFRVSESEITELRCLKAGMTNKSFIFKNSAISDDAHFICRIPGKGTELLINRENEYNSYAAIKELNLAENIVFMDPKTGYKISKYYENSRNADFTEPEELRLCMERLRFLHESNIRVKHDFDVRERMEYFENLCGGNILFQDYDDVKRRMDALLSMVEGFDRKKTLCHIDPICDNFLFVKNGNHAKIRLIDWEYSGMADPLIDIAMCAIYSYFNKEESDALIEIYLQRKASDAELFLYYSYMALGGFLWTLWAIYKSNLGEIYGDYTLKMYRYAKDFERLALETLKNPDA